MKEVYKKLQAQQVKLVLVEQLVKQVHQEIRDRRVHQDFQVMQGSLLSGQQVQKEIPGQLVLLDLQDQSKHHPSAHKVLHSPTLR
jgi:hypothetical protein